MACSSSGNNRTSKEGESDWDWSNASDVYSEGVYSKKFSSAINMMVNANKHGIVMNKLLAWMDVQKDTTPSDTWKAHLKMSFTEEEILDAKVMLFEAVGGETSTIGVFKKHHVKQKHLDDLVDAVGKLWDANEMPLVIASSKMIKTMRNYSLVDSSHENIADAVNKIKELENTVKACFKKNTDQIRSLAEVVSTIKHGSSGEKSVVPQPPVTNNRVLALINENEKRDNGGITPPSKKRKSDEQHMNIVNSFPALVTNQSSSLSGIQALSPCTSESATVTPRWSTVAAGPGHKQHQPGTKQNQTY